MAATIIRFGEEQQVNVVLNLEQSGQRVTALPDGGWLITWTSDGQDSSSAGIYQQRYDKDGNALWELEHQVNTFVISAQYEPDVTTLVDGGWVVTWTSFEQDGQWGGIYQRRYNADGTPKTGEQQVSTETADHQYESSVTALSGGGWVVTWTSVEQDGSYEGIYQQRYDLDGNAVGGEQRVNTQRLEGQYEPSVTALPDGEWLVTWTSIFQDGSGEGIYQQRYSADGTPKGGEQRVNTHTSGRQIEPSVTVLGDGGWIVTWTSNEQDGSGLGIYQQRYDATGTRVGEEQRVNTETAGDQHRPSVSALGDGGWIVTWDSKDQDGSSEGIYQQRYDADGNRVGGELQVNVYETDAQFQPSVAGLADGGWLTSWTSVSQDGSVTEVYQRRYMPVAEFGEGREQGTGTAGDDLFQVRTGGLAAGDSLYGGDGNDTLQMSEAGTLDLTAPDVFNSIETIRGSSGNDTIVLSKGLLSRIAAFHGGSGVDALLIGAGSHDLSDTVLSGIETITLTGTGSLTFDDKATALLARSMTQEGTVVLTGASFTLAERTQLYNQGFRKVTDAGGVHILQQAQVSLSTKSVTENAGAGTPIGTLSAIDPNPGDGLRFELIDSAGGRFALSGNQLVVANGSLLDYEAGTSHRIVVRVIDEGGLTTDAAFTITLGDVPVEIIKGTSRADVLVGGSGKDRLYGGLGKDTLTGDKGQDIFVFDTKANTKTNRDKIVDFSVTDDTIWLDNKVFTKLGKAGSEKKPMQLKKDSFTVGSKAKDANDYIVYDKTKGVLFYDADGSGKGKAVEIATLSKKLAMTYKDFFVI